MERWERGTTLIDVLLGVALGALVIGSLAFAATTYGRSLRASAAAQAATTAQTTLVASLETDARSAIAVFTPPQDVADADNRDGHEVDFYLRDAAGAGHFQAYCFRAGAPNCPNTQAAGSVAIYRYAWSDLPQHGGSGTTASGTLAQGLSAFAATTLNAAALLDPTRNPTTAAYFRQIGVTAATVVERQTGYPGVLAGNDVAVVTLANSAGSRTVHLLAGAQPTRRAVVVAQYTPPPTPLGVSTGALNFANPLAAAQTVTLSEANYGARTTTPSQTYAAIGSSCGAVAAAAPAAVVPTADGSGQGQVRVTPIVQVAPSGEHCQVVYADNTGQTQTISIAIGATFAPSASGPSAGRPNQFGVFTVREQNYPGAFTAATAGPCDSLSLLGASVDGAGTFTGQWQVHFTAYGTCAFSATDAYGQVTSAQAQVYEDPSYLLTLGAPNPAAVSPGGSFTFTAATALTNAGRAAPGTPATIAVQATSWYPCTPNPTGQQPSGTLYTVITQSATCTVEISAPGAANSPQGVTVSVYAAPQYALAVAGMPASLLVGDAPAFTASATLQDAAGAAPGTASSIPVKIVPLGGPCTGSPSGWQSSGTSFALGATASGTCNLQVGAQDGELQSFAIPIYAAAAYALQLAGPASTTLAVNGASTTLQLAAPLQDANAAPPGTPSSLTVGVSASGPCSVSPSGWQPSGSTFTIAPGTSAGTCTLTASANGPAQNNNQSVAITVTGQPNRQLYDQCSVPYGQLVSTDTSTTPPTDHLGTGLPCPTPSPAPAPSSFAIAFTIAGTATATSDGGGTSNCSQSAFFDTPTWIAIPNPATAAHPISISVIWTVSRNPSSSTVGTYAIGVQDPAFTQGYVTTGYAQYDYPGIQSWNPTVIVSGAPAGNWAFGVTAGCPTVSTARPSSASYTATATVSITQP